MLRLRLFLIPLILLATAVVLVAVSAGAVVVGGGLPPGGGGGGGTIPPVPEPGTGLLLALGIVGLAVRKHRRS